MDELYRCGCPVDAVDERERTVLYLAAAAGYDDAVEYLLAHGADPTLTAMDGRSALHAAAAAGHVSTCRLIYSAAAAISPSTAARLAQAKDGEGRSVAEIAAAARHLDIVRELLIAPTRKVAARAVPAAQADPPPPPGAVPRRMAPGGAAAACCSAASWPTGWGRQVRSTYATADGHSVSPSTPVKVELLEPGCAELERYAQRRGYAAPVLHTPGSKGSVYFNGSGYVPTP